MKRTIALLVLASSLPALFAQALFTVSPDLDSTPGMNPIFIQEIKLQKTIQTKDFHAFKAMLLSDFLFVSDNLQNADQFINSMKKCDVGRFAIENHQVRMLGHESAVINYRLTPNMTCGKQTRSYQYNVTTIWVLRDGKWFVQLHTETPIPASQ